jgi:hypothetical protein
VTGAGFSTDQRIRTTEDTLRPAPEPALIAIDLALAFVAPARPQGHTSPPVGSRTHA